MTRTKAVSLFLAVVLMLTVAAISLTPAAQTLTSANLLDAGRSTAVMAEHSPANAPVIACGGCSGGGSGGG